MSAKHPRITIPEWVIPLSQAIVVDPLLMVLVGSFETSMVGVTTLYEGQEMLRLHPCPDEAINKMTETIQQITRHIPTEWTEEDRTQGILPSPFHPVTLRELIPLEVETGTSVLLPPFPYQEPDELHPCLQQLCIFDSASQQLRIHVFANLQRVHERVWEGEDMDGLLRFFSIAFNDEQIRNVLDAIFLYIGFPSPVLSAYRRGQALIAPDISDREVPITDVPNFLTDRQRRSIAWMRKKEMDPPAVQFIRGFRLVPGLICTDDGLQKDPGDFDEPETLALGVNANHLGAGKTLEMLGLIYSDHDNRPTLLLTDRGRAAWQTDYRKIFGTDQGLEWLEPTDIHVPLRTKIIAVDTQSWKPEQDPPAWFRRCCPRLIIDQSNPALLLSHSKFAERWMRQSMFCWFVLHGPEEFQLHMNAICRFLHVQYMDYRPFVLRDSCHDDIPFDEQEIQHVHILPTALEREVSRSLEAKVPLRITAEGHVIVGTTCHVFPPDCPAALRWIHEMTQTPRRVAQLDAESRYDYPVGFFQTQWEALANVSTPHLCGICHEEHTPRTLGLLPCGHIFCTSCLHADLETCPLCRKSISLRGFTQVLHVGWTLSDQFSSSLIATMAQLMTDHFQRGGNQVLILAPNLSSVSNYRKMLEKQGFDYDHDHRRTKTFAVYLQEEASSALSDTLDLILFPSDEPLSGIDHSTPCLANVWKCITKAHLQQSSCRFVNIVERA